MISERLGSVLALLTLACATLLGLGIGYVVYLLLRDVWTQRRGLIDCAVALVAMVTTIFTVAMIDRRSGVAESRVVLALCVSMCTVIVSRMLVRPAR